MWQLQWVVEGCIGTLINECLGYFPVKKDFPEAITTKMLYVSKWADKLFVIWNEELVGNIILWLGWGVRHGGKCLASIKSEVKEKGGKKVK